jgi:hypothetical protein
MSSASKAATDIETIGADLAALKRDFAALMEHLKAGAVNGANGSAKYAASKLSDEAQQLYGKLASEGTRQVQALSRQIEAQPIASLFIAFAAGFIGSRLLQK